MISHFAASLSLYLFPSSPSYSYSCEQRHKKYDKDYQKLFYNSYGYGFPKNDQYHSPTQYEQQNGRIFKRRDERVDDRRYNERIYKR